MPTVTENKKILVVDDEERMLRFIRLNLEHDGFQVIEAVKGHEALDKMRTGMPDLILLRCDASGSGWVRSIEDDPRNQHCSGDHADCQR